MKMVGSWMGWGNLERREGIEEEGYGCWCGGGHGMMLQTLTALPPPPSFFTDNCFCAAMDQPPPEAPKVQRKEAGGRQKELQG